MPRPEYSFLDCIHDIADDLEFYRGRTISGRIGALFDTRFKIFFWYRISRYYYLKSLKIRWIHTFIKYRYLKLGGNDIDYRAIVGKRITMSHPSGIVIGRGVTIEDDVILFQQTTFGSHGRKDKMKAYPTIKSGAVIFSGAKVIGGVTVGRNAIVGANSVVLSDVPDGCTVVGAPARIVKQSYSNENFRN